MRATLQKMAQKITVGNTLPDVSIFKGLPPVAAQTAQLFANRRVLVFGLPGAFTPGCSREHLPGFVQKSKEIKEKLGVEEIFCIASNDSFVMDAWGKAHNAEGAVTMLADPANNLSSATGLSVNKPALGGLRYSRFSMVLDNNVVKYLAEEPDGTGLTCSLAPAILSAKF